MVVTENRMLNWIQAKSNNLHLGEGTKGTATLILSLSLSLDASVSEVLVVDLI